ncbi:MAG: malate dehydrogenase, partial [Candidatus Aminicenantes bacterium]|nr:malate dehydrogenase [Candidatus Aminicenantes bacterium]
PGPGKVTPEWVKGMAKDAVLFACANPIPAIWPWEAKAAGARIVATGRSDFANQVNNSLGFPGILKGALVVRAKKITDEMAIAAAYSMANFAQKKGLNPDRIMPTMDETEVFAQEAADVAMEAIKNGVARITTYTWQDVFDKTMADIQEARDAMGLLMKKKFIKAPPLKLLRDAVKKAVKAVK